MKKISIILLSLTTIVITSVLIQSCASPKLAERGGAQLWGENCMRCHSTPPPNSFSSEQWETISMHMRIRAGLTDDEIKKIAEFLQSDN
jgi:hypothetical protein